jgi:hypothetical protein
LPFGKRRLNSNMLSTERERGQPNTLLASRTRRRNHLGRFWTLLFVWHSATLISVLAQEGTKEYAVQLSADVQSSPAQIILNWPQDTALNPSNYTVYRKLINDASWGVGTLLVGTATNFVDTNVADGSTYEYQVIKVTSDYTGYGYIYAGIDAPLTEARGKLVLMVDNTYAADLTSQLTRLQQDLVGDGWAVLRHDVSPTNSVDYVKSLIQTDYSADPGQVNTVFLFGHIPVPYSGNLVPDDHIPEHMGAWPADVFYADMIGDWTDSTVYNTNATDERNWNVPGDGKFDQSSLPAPVQLMVGRVDLSNMPGQTSWDGPPTFPDEKTLLGNYLDKDHAYRQKLFDLPRRGLVGDYFGIFHGEAFAASGWRNFAPFFGSDNITSLPDEGTWLPTLSSEGYLWSYGCGSGGYDSVGGLGNDDAYYTAITPDIYNADIQSAFVMLFGSWFGDWDSQDDLMRTVLATPHYGLACVWSGRPHWFCQHMALGQTIGYSTRLTQNNGTNGLYQTQRTGFAGLVHVALMGDPTLRMHTVSPPANLTATNVTKTVNLTWDSSPDTVVGYHIYRADDDAGPFTRINGALVTGNSFADFPAPAGFETYMVRAVKLEATPSGTYSNASQGIFLTLNVTNGATRLTISATSNASRVGLMPGMFTLHRSGDTNADLTANYSLGGTAAWNTDYQLNPADGLASITIPAGAASATLTVVPLSSSTWIGAKTVLATLATGSQYTLGLQSNAAIWIGGNGPAGVSIQVSNSTASLAWPSAPGRVYRVAYESNLNNAWIDFGINVYATSQTTSWNDPGTNLAPQRFYRVFETK